MECIKGLFGDVRKMHQENVTMKLGTIKSKEIFCSILMSSWNKTDDLHKKCVEKVWELVKLRLHHL